MKSIFAALADTINNHPKTVAATIVVIMVFGLYGATMVTMATGTETYIDITTPEGSLIYQYENTYGSDMIFLMVEGENLYDPEVLAYLDTVTADISNEQHITSVYSVADVVKAANGGTIPGSAAEIQAIVEEQPNMLTANGQTGMMTLVGADLEAGLSEEVQSAVLQNIKVIIDAIPQPPGVTVTVTGSPAFAEEMQEEMGTSTGMLIGLALLLMVVAMGLLFGNVRYRFLPVAIVVMGVILSFGVMGWSKTPLSMVVMAAFPVMIGIGIDYAIQFQTRFDEEVRKGSIRDAVTTTITQSGPAVMVALGATCLGFFALSIAPFPMVVDFGVICIIGVACCYLSALVVIPTFGTLVQYRPLESREVRSKGKKSGPGMMERYDMALGSVAGKIANNPVPILLLLGCVAVLGIPLDSEVIISTDEESMVPQDMPAMVSMSKLGDVVGSTSSLPLIVRSNDVLAPDVLQWMDEFGNYATDHNDEITGATSIATLLTAANGGTLPTDKVAIEEALALIPEDTREGYLTGGTEAVIQFSMIDISMSEADGVVSKLESDLDWREPPAGVTAVFSGQIVMFTGMISDITESKAGMNILGFILITGFLILVYRRVAAITPMIPIIMIIGWNTVIMYVLGLQYNLLTATLGAMSIGIASEYTILIMERYDEERERGCGCTEAIQTAIQKIGTAITISGLTTVFGFSALTLSDFPIMSNFGLVTVLTVGFSLIGAILVMPAVLSLTCRYRDHHAKNENAAVGH
ncbi:hydrogenase expression protein HypA [Methanomicrobiaceae archaeon CYW5]|uniref:efflux RND transporter permease subunit n=1 Tax=Methanovulcanius yangii TaxID=1789227 RepID=UPI0029C9C78F|nr:RND family transporter [Methanovulcanius yangii]MBT8508397.1 hydrogenase expression protein HypA [Methanovulcanius yangii]